MVRGRGEMAGVLTGSSGSKTVLMAAMILGSSCAAFSASRTMPAVLRSEGDVAGVVGCGWITGSGFIDRS